METIFKRKLYAKGSIFFMNCEYAKAYLVFEELIAQFPTVPDFYFGRAFAEFHLGDLNSALNDYTYAIQLNRTYMEAYYWRAQVWAIKEENKKYLADMLKAVETGRKHAGDPLVITVFKELALVFTESKFFEEAMNLLNHLLKIEPDPEIYYLRARCYLGLGKSLTAYADFKKAVELDPQNRKYKKRTNRLRERIIAQG